MLTIDKGSWGAAAATDTAGRSRSVGFERVRGDDGGFSARAFNLRYGLQVQKTRPHRVEVCKTSEVHFVALPIHGVLDVAAVAAAVAVPG